MSEPMNRVAPDAEQQEQVRSRKRAATHQLTKDNVDEEEVPENPQNMQAQRAPPEVLAQRRILRVRRPEGAPTPTATGVFAGLPTSASVPPQLALRTTGFGSGAAVLSPPVNPFAPTTTPAPLPAATTAAAVPASSAGTKSFASLNAMPNAAAVPNVFGAGSTFKFSFNAPPPAANETARPAVSPTASQPLSLTHIVQEEDPNVVTTYSEPLKLFQRDGEEWKDRGDVTVKVITNTKAAQPWGVLLAEASKTLRTALKAPIASVKVGTRAERQLHIACANGTATGIYTLRAAKDADHRIASLVEAIAKAQEAVTAATRA
jgi:hypothetical protein